MTTNPEANAGVGQTERTIDTPEVRGLLDDLAKADLRSLYLAISSLRRAYIESQSHPELLNRAEELQRLVAFTEHALVSAGYTDDNINRPQRHKDVQPPTHDPSRPRTNL